MNDISIKYKAAADRVTEARYRKESRFSAHRIFYAILRRMNLKILMKVLTFYGTKMWVSLPEFASCSIQQFGLIDIETPVYIASYLREGMIFMDIGAHYGFYSMLAGKITGPSGRTYSFEPTPATYTILARNSGTVANATAEMMAISDSTNPVSFVAYAHTSSAFNHIYNPNETAVTGTIITARCTTLDAYCHDKSLLPDLIKLDTEGYELHALKGAENTISQGAPAFVIEFGMTKEDKLAPAIFLTQRDYAVFSAQTGTLKSTDLTEIEASEPGSNFFFVHKSKLNRIVPCY